MNTVAKNAWMIENTMGLLQQIQGLIHPWSRRIKILSFVSLVLSVLTSGALWLLLSDVVPIQTLWFGAIASTITTLIFAYIKGFAVERQRDQALDIHDDILKFLARLRATPDYSEKRFWDEYKAIEARMYRLQHGEPK